MKISDYFTISALTAGLSTALAGSWWLYSGYFGLDPRFTNTFFGLIFIYLLLRSNKLAEWFWSGFFIGLFWFWWIGISFYYYHLAWLVPIAIFGIAAIYGVIFWLIALIAQKLPTPNPRLSTLAGKSIMLLLISYIHPFGFDWLKPELVFVHSYLGVAKWQLGTVLLAAAISVLRRQPLFLVLAVLAYSPTKTQVLNSDPSHTFKLVSTHTAIKDKWDTSQKQKHINEALNAIDNAIDNHYRVVVLPESIMPFFVNRDPRVLGQLLERSYKIEIIIGALYWDHGIHRNSAYFFGNGKYTVANKVVLVPFGESNPLPQWASNFVNKLFFDGAIDYTASGKPTDWEIEGKKYRNAICYEGTSEKLYADNPQNMILISNNAWFVPSIEPTFQRLLLQYYTRKYGTTIYHSANMSDSYIIQRK
jgi:apolipoprotein N-acyltransferase